MINNQDNNASSMQRLKVLLKHYRVPLLVIIHIFLFTAIFWFAIMIRHEILDWRYTPAGFLRLIKIVLPVKIAIFYALGSFHGWWRHVTFSDLFLLARAATVACFAIASIVYFYPVLGAPKAVLLIDWLTTIVVLSGFRSMWRFWDEKISATSIRRHRALLVGDNSEAAQLAHLVNSRSQIKHRIVGLVSPNANYRKAQFSDLNVVGSLKDLPRLRREYRASRLLIPFGSVSVQQVRELLDKQEQLDVEISVLPQLSEMMDGHERIPVRPVAYEDLLGRDPVKLDTTSIGQMLNNATVLVTGAGGSIGSELCRQIIAFNPKQLILLGRGENRIFHIHRELLAKNGSTELVTIIASATDRTRMEEIFKTYQPEIVFHAAAHKHVPLTECNIGEAVINNVLGTQNVADLSSEYGVKRFVLISTDKAVNPTSVMGCTKQLAERYCTALGAESSTKFVVTRFGNVLGSEGSVVPIFQKQIADGGPITITDASMTRYFMTIPEASQLVVQAAAMGNGSEIFVLEMGKPVKIVDMARDLIRLAGLPPDSIEIKITGIRPGEKTYEELYYDEEHSKPTPHPKILVAEYRQFEYEMVRKETSDLIDLAYDESSEISDRLQELIPEYRDNLLKARAACWRASSSFCRELVLDQLKEASNSFKLAF
ncbi:MAG: nucleoside-diphosphate sugar epimerase/dehydratase [Pirellulales bacterium]